MLALVVMLLVVLLQAVPALAQAGSVTGLVTDPSSLAVPGATVPIANDCTGVIRTTVSNDNGCFTTDLLPQGTYTGRVELAGVRPLRQTLVRLNDAQVLRLDGSARRFVGASAACPSMTPVSWSR